jgi:hypothetical protein
MIYAMFMTPDPETQTSTNIEVEITAKNILAVLRVANFCLGAISIAGAISALQKRRYLLALVGAYAIVIPCFSPLFGIGIPLGAWAMVVLLHPQVKASFR